MSQADLKIYVSGTSNSGKTTLIVLLQEFLKQNGVENVVYVNPEETEDQRKIKLDAFKNNSDHTLRNKSVLIIEDYKPKELVREYPIPPNERFSPDEIVPIYNEFTKNCFVDKKQWPRTRFSIGGLSYETAPLKFGQKINLIGISQTDELLEQGLVNSTDIIDLCVQLKTVYLKVEDDLVYEIDTTNKHFSNVVFSGGSDHRTGYLDYRSTFGLQKDCMILDLDIVVTGIINLETAEVCLNAGNFLKIDPDFELIGYDLKINRVKRKSTASDNSQPIEP